MTRLLTLVNCAVQLFETRLGTGELCALCNMAGDPLLVFATVALNWHIDVAGGTRTGMTHNIADIVLAIFVFLFFTVLTTRMRQDQRIKFRLSKPIAEAVVLWHFVLSIRVVAIRARPAEEGSELANGLLVSAQLALVVCLII